MSHKSQVEKRVSEIKRRTRRKYNTEEKIRIVLEGFRGESSIALQRQEQIIHVGSSKFRLSTVLNCHFSDK